MANNFDSNFTRQLARIFLEKFESARVLSKNVDTQLLTGRFDPASGENVDFKRPTDYTSSRSPTGDATGIADDIITGKATGTVQDYFTVLVDFNEADQALKMDQIDQLLAPMATRIVTDMELDFASFMMKNSGLLTGTVGTAADTWPDIARAGATMMATGIPQDDPWYYAVNPFTQAVLSNIQRSLGSGGTSGELVKTAHEKATITTMFAGFDEVMTATTLASFTSATSSDLVGAVNGTPDATYLTAKDTMTQSITVDGFTDTFTLKAGQMVQITGRNRLNLSTREQIVDDTGATVLFTGTLTADAVITSGAGTIIVTGPGLFVDGSPYNTIASAIADNDVITILNASNTLFQPNLFWHKQAFSIGSVPLKKLFATDTLAETEDGLQLRVTKFSDGLTNVQSVRFDLRPAYAVLNPFFSGHGWGV